MELCDCIAEKTKIILLPWYVSGASFIISLNAWRQDIMAAVRLFLCSSPPQDKLTLPGTELRKNIVYVKGELVKREM